MNEKRTHFKSNTELSICREICTDSKQLYRNYSIFWLEKPEFSYYYILIKSSEKTKTNVEVRI